MYHSAMEPRPVSRSSFVPLLRRMSYLILKRGFDLVFSLVLLVTCALLMAVIALVVWLDSPGKIIYTQIRLGYGWKPFTIYKFRSMQQSTAPDDAKDVYKRQAQGSKPSSYSGRNRAGPDSNR